MFWICRSLALGSRAGGLGGRRTDRKQLLLLRETRQDALWMA